ncbi:MAG: hypothetical protein AVDCRST_MAG73-653, partial [uncultured Thermomicrobiales bacterium]
GAVSTVGRRSQRGTGNGRGESERGVPVRKPAWKTRLERRAPIRVVPTAATRRLAV